MIFFTLDNLAKLAVAVAIVKFFGEGGITLFNHSFSFGHTDSTTYAMFLGPILGHAAYTAGSGGSTDGTVTKA